MNELKCRYKYFPVIQWTGNNIEEVSKFLENCEMLDYQYSFTEFETPGGGTATYLTINQCGIPVNHYIIYKFNSGTAEYFSPKNFKQYFEEILE